MQDIIPQQRAPRDRLARLYRLTPDQIEAGMAWLAGYDPVVFEAVIDAAETWNDGGMFVLAE